MVTKAETIADERIRIQKILQSPEGLSHPKTAIHFALETSLTPDVANATMADLPKESAFLEAMEHEGIGIKPGTSQGAGIVNNMDAREARLVELRQNTQMFNVTRGYRPKSER